MGSSETPIPGRMKFYVGIAWTLNREKYFSNEPCLYFNFLESICKNLKVVCSLCLSSTLGIMPAGESYQKA